VNGTSCVPALFMTADTYKSFHMVFISWVCWAGDRRRVPTFITIPDTYCSIHMTYKSFHVMFNFFGFFGGK